MCCRRRHGLGRCYALKRATEKVREVARVRQDPKTTRRRKRSAALAAASVALTGLYKASNDLNIPGLKASIGIAKEIADRAQKAKRNKDDCLAIVENIRALVETLVDATKDRTLADVDERLVHDIQRFGCDLESIHVSMTEVASPRLWKRMTITSDDKKIIKDCMEKLDAAYKAFIFRPHGLHTVLMHAGTRIGVIALIHGQHAMTPTLTHVEDQLEASHFYILALRVMLIASSAVDNRGTSHRARAGAERRRYRGVGHSVSQRARCATEIVSSVALPR
ncbi:hypothetical protein NEOLEDRAFT_1147476 [Neolentinus lepideus HHB14362 ss-1]|uniref:Uncharacterized protein n=1 Tax=Neolentinus lepideus HHB14362 ss-1 TaxID=1314782 RepID=A0A165T2V4_9AGAM|nr:hypothetical protein NEOLEDRAFT_1147476 [Neolentinus lepideus HHB14362 ss-1]